MIYLLVGTRPNYIKAFPVYKYFKSRGVNIRLIHSLQHYDNNLTTIFFNELGINKDDITFLKRDGTIFDNLYELFKKERPKLVIVVGDVNTSLYGAIASVHNNIKLVHIEAGLRSYDNNMIEELNRKAIDSVSNYFFCTELGAISNLKKENIVKNVYFVGNTMIDTLVSNYDKIKYYNYKEELGLVKENYIVCTLHRQSNVDNPKIIDYILFIINEISKYYKVILPLHPRTKKNINKAKYKNIVFIEPLSYLQFMSLVYDSKCVITDSGGVQEETTFMNKLCLTLRKNTERPITIVQGTNHLINIDFDSIMGRIKNYKKKENINIDYWDGKASQRIYEIMLKENLL